MNVSKRPHSPSQGDKQPKRSKDQQVCYTDIDPHYYIHTVILPGCVLRPDWGSASQVIHAHMHTHTHTHTQNTEHYQLLFYR